MSVENNRVNERKRYCGVKCCPTHLERMTKTLQCLGK